MGTAFEITADDVETVLRNNSLKVANTKGMSFSAMAELLLCTEIDADRAEKAALYYDSLDDQTTAALEEIHRQLHLKRFISVPPESHNDAIGFARATIVERLAREATGKDPEELAKDFKQGFVGFGSMSDKELAIHARKSGLADILSTELEALGVHIPRYIVGEWNHLFGPGKRETETRICYDTESEQIVAAQIKDGPADDDFVAANRWQIADLEDSLKNANPEAISNPDDFGLEFEDELPEWAITEPETQRESQRA